MMREQILAACSDQWHPEYESEGTVRLTQDGEEIVVDEESVAGGKVKIADYDYSPEQRLPGHKVKVQLMEEHTASSTEYRYVATVVDETRQDIEGPKQDAARRITESDLLSESRSSIMSDMNSRSM